MEKTITMETSMKFIFALTLLALSLSSFAGNKLRGECESNGDEPAVDRKISIYLNGNSNEVKKAVVSIYGFTGSAISMETLPLDTNYTWLETERGTPYVVVSYRSGEGILFQTVCEYEKVSRND